MEAKTKKTALISVLLILSLAAITGIIQISKTKAVEVAVAVLEERSLSDSISVTGRIESEETYETVLSSSQKVIKLYKKVGDYVKAGDTLVTLDTEDLQYQLNKAALSLDSLKVSTGNAKAQASINLDTAKDSYALASRSYHNIKTLYEAGAVSKDDFDKADNALKLAESQVKLAEIQYNNLNLNSSSSDVQKQMERLNLNIQNLQRKIDESTIKTPISGTLTLLEARENQYPSRSQGQVQVMDLNRLIVKADVSQYDTVLLSPGQRASVKVKGLSPKLTGRITSVGDVSTPASSSAEPKYEVKIALDDSVQDIKIDYDVDVDIFIKEKANIPAADRQAVQAENGRKFVFVIADGKAVKKYIKTGLETDLYVEILEGLSVGEQYLTAPPDSLKEGARVEPAV